LPVPTAYVPGPTVITGPTIEAEVAVAAAEVEAMAAGVVAAGVVTGALVPVDELHPAMTRPAARANTDPRMTPSSGAREQALRRTRSP
jgi:hypothetical protein